MVYSGNLNDFADVVEKFRSIDLKVYNHMYYLNGLSLTMVASVRVETSKGDLLATRELMHWDNDTLLSMVTGWLRETYSILSDWK